MLQKADIVDLIKRPDPVILDIGANNGDQTVLFVAMFPAARIFAFEPDPRAIQRFRENVKSDRVSLTQAAVGRSTGKATFYQSSGKPPDFDHLPKELKLPDDWDLSGSIRKPKEHLTQHPWCKFDNTLEIDVVSLDDWCSETACDHIDFIWADVQGAEEDLILGGLKALSKTKYFYTEYSDRELYHNQKNLDSIKKMLPEFEVAALFDGDVLFKNIKI